VITRISGSVSKPQFLTIRQGNRRNKILHTTGFPLPVCEGQAAFPRKTDDPVRVASIGPLRDRSVRTSKTGVPALPKLEAIVADGEVDRTLQGQVDPPSLDLFL